MIYITHIYWFSWLIVYSFVCLFVWSQWSQPLEFPRWHMTICLQLKPKLNFNHFDFLGLFPWRSYCPNKTVQVTRWLNQMIDYLLIRAVFHILYQAFSQYNKKCSETVQFQIPVKLWYIFWTTDNRWFSFFDNWLLMGSFYLGYKFVLYLELGHILWMSTRKFN